MDLSIDFASVTRGRAGPSACGVVITDRTSARTIHETGHYLGDQPSAQAALVAALSEALDAAVPLEPQAVELRCASELLVRQVTGQSPGGDTPQNLLDEVTMKLLALDSWRIVATDAAESIRAAESLAERALAGAGQVSDLEAEDAKRRRDVRFTGVPQWTVQLMEEPEGCPAACRCGQRFAFGPDIPAGLCVHAALIALTDGPMVWNDPQQRQMTTLCPHCSCTIRIRQID